MALYIFQYVQGVFVHHLTKSLCLLKMSESIKSEPILRQFPLCENEIVIFLWKVWKQCPLLVMGDIQLTIFQLGTSHTHTTQHPQKPSQLELLLSIPQTFAINPCVAILWGLIYKTLLLLLHLFIYFRSKVSVGNQ